MHYLRLDLPHGVEHFQVSVATKSYDTNTVTTRDLNYLPKIAQQVFGRNKNELRSLRSLMCNLTLVPISTCRFKITCVIDIYDTDTDN